MIINSDVFDIVRYEPITSDQFFVDTNVLFWSSYTHASIACSKAYQATNYPNFILKVVNTCKATGLYYSSINVSELAHVVEKSERDLFAKNNGIDSLHLKTFRNTYPEEWKKFKDEMNNVVMPYIHQFNEKDIKVDKDLNDSMLKQMTANSVDAYDCYMVSTMKKCKILKIITDDSDLVKFNDLEVYTSNLSVIDAARAQGKLKN